MVTREALIAWPEYLVFRPCTRGLFGPTPDGSTLLPSQTGVGHDSDSAGEWHDEALSGCKAGAPQRLDFDKDAIESMELNHQPFQRETAAGTGTKLAAGSC